MWTDVRVVHVCAHLLTCMSGALDFGSDGGEVTLTGVADSDWGGWLTKLHHKLVLMGLNQLTRLASVILYYMWSPAIKIKC